ncbi:MAG: hypothetical protein PVH88_00010 [Ignavibacteria bacterium]|jgi:hypothetical protein
MKRFLILFIIIISSKFSAQDCPPDIETYKYVAGFPYGRIAPTYDYTNSYVIKWNDNKINGESIYLDDINIYLEIPFELLNETDQFEDLLQSVYLPGVKKDIPPKKEKHRRCFII